MRPSTDVHDYEVRLRSAEKFLKKVRHRSAGALPGVEAQLSAGLRLPLVSGEHMLPFRVSITATQQRQVMCYVWRGTAGLMQSKGFM